MLAHNFEWNKSGTASGSHLNIEPKIYIFNINISTNFLHWLSTVEPLSRDHPDARAPPLERPFNYVNLNIINVLISTLDERPPLLKGHWCKRGGLTRGVPLYLFVCDDSCIFSHRKEYAALILDQISWAIKLFYSSFVKDYHPKNTRISHYIKCLFVCFGLTSLWNIWGHIATVPACSSGILTNVLPQRNVMPQTQDTTPHPVTVYRHGADLSLCYPLMWNVTLEYTATHFNVMG